MIVSVALAIVRAPLLLFRRSSGSSSTSSRQQQREEREREQQQQQRARAGGGAGARGKGGSSAARRRGGNAAEPEEEEQQPEKPPPAPTQGVSLKSLVNASRAAARSSGGGGSGGGAPQAPASAASSPLHLSLLKGHGDGIASVAFSADGAFLLSASRDRGLRQWPMMPSASDPETPLRRGAPPTPAQPRTRNLAASPLAAGFIGGDSSGGIAVLSRDGLNGPTLTAIPAFGSGSGGSGNDAPPLWAARPAPLIGGRRPVALLCSSSPSSPSSSAPAAAPPLLAVVSERTELETFDAATGHRTAAVDTGGLRTHGACCSADGALFAVATFASDAKVYSFGSAAAGGTNNNSKASSVQKAGWSLSHAGQVLAVSLSLDGSRAATSSRDGTWASWKAPPRSGKGLASGERAEAVRLGAWRQDLSLPPGEFYRLLSLSPDGTVLAAAAGGDLHFLSAASGDLLGCVSPAHGGEVTALCWAPRRRKVEGEAEERWILASGGDDRAVRLWAAPEAAGGGGGGGGSGWQRG